MYHFRPNAAAGSGDRPLRSKAGHSLHVLAVRLRHREHALRLGADHLAELGVRRNIPSFVELVLLDVRPDGPDASVRGILALQPSACRSAEQETALNSPFPALRSAATLFFPAALLAFDLRWP